MEVKIIEDSISLAGKRLTTFQLKYWRAIHAEVLTHRVFTKNASSSRAIPVAKMIEQVRTNPAGPMYWGSNKPGMQAGAELTGDDLEDVKEHWLENAEAAACSAEYLMDLGLHKQVTNRILEPFQWIHVVLTATEFENFFDLRIHPDAQPEIQALAFAMQTSRFQSIPKVIQHGEWHLPYVTQEERNDSYFKENPELLRKISAARCCRVSYLRHDGKTPSIADDLALCEKLAGSRPIHASPFEHIATPLADPTIWSGNFQGWHQYRKDIEASFN